MTRDPIVDARNYFVNIQRAHSNSDGFHLLEYLKIDNCLHVVEHIKKEDDFNMIENIAKDFVENQLVRDLAELSLLISFEWRNNNLYESFQYFRNVYKVIADGINPLSTSLFANTTHWFIPIFKYYVQQGKNVIKKIRISQQSNNLQNEQIRRFFHGDLIQIFNSCCLISHDEIWGENVKHMAQFLVNSLLELHFKLDTLRGCEQLLTRFKQLYWPSNKNLQKQGSSIPSSLILRSEAITYKYYTSRLMLLNGNYDEAYSYLTDIFKECPQSSWRNKRKILAFLIPLKMLNGILPTSILLKKYQLLGYSGFADALRYGNINQFEKTLSLHKSYFMRIGTYMIFEKLKDLVFIEFLRKYKNWFIDDTLEVKNDLYLFDLKRLCQVLSINGCTLDISSVRCKFYNLIGLSVIKGNVVDDQFIILKSCLTQSSVFRRTEQGSGVSEKNYGNEKGYSRGKSDSNIDYNCRTAKTAGRLELRDADRCTTIAQINPPHMLSHNCHFFSGKNQDCNIPGNNYWRQQSVQSICSSSSKFVVPTFSDDNYSDSTIGGDDVDSEDEVKGSDQSFDD